MAGQHHEQIRTHHLRTDIRFAYLVPDRKVVFREFSAARTCRQLFCRDAEFEISGAFCGPNDQLQRFRYCSGGPVSAAALAVDSAALAHLNQWLPQDHDLDAYLAAMEARQPAQENRIHRGRIPDGWRRGGGAR